MKLLRFFGNFFAYILMGLAITLMFAALLTNNVFKSTDHIDQLLTTNVKAYVSDHKSEVKDFLMEQSQTLNLNIDKNQIKDICAGEKPPVSKDFCLKMDALTEEQAKNAFVQDLVDNQIAGGAFDSQISQFAGDANKQVAGAVNPIKEKIGNPMNYFLGGIVLYLLSVGLIFLSSGFNIKLSLYKTARDTLFNTLPFVVAFGVIAALTPQNLIDVIMKISGNSELTNLPAIIVNMIMSVVLGALKSATNPLLIIAVIVALASLTLVIVMKILKDD